MSYLIITAWLFLGGIAAGWFYSDLTSEMSSCSNKIAFLWSMVALLGGPAAFIAIAGARKERGVNTGWKLPGSKAKRLSG